MIAQSAPVKPKSIIRRTAVGTASMTSADANSATSAAAAHGLVPKDIGPQRRQRRQRYPPPPGPVPCPFAVLVSLAQRTAGLPRHATSTSNRRMPDGYRILQVLRAREENPVRCERCALLNMGQSKPFRNSARSGISRGIHLMRRPAGATMAKPDTIRDPKPACRKDSSIAPRATPAPGSRCWQTFVTSTRPTASTRWRRRPSNTPMRSASSFPTRTAPTKASSHSRTRTASGCRSATT